jgi:hypothetical protein
MRAHIKGLYLAGRTDLLCQIKSGNPVAGGDIQNT